MPTTTPDREIHELRERVNRMFDDWVSARSRPAGSAVDPEWRPTTDLLEEGDRYVLAADLPGVRADDVEIRVDARVLSIRGNRETDRDRANEELPDGGPVDTVERYLRRERPNGRFSIELELPESVDAERIAARHLDGVLEVSLPKRATLPTETIRIRID